MSVISRLPISPARLLAIVLTLILVVGSPFGSDASQRSSKQSATQKKHDRKKSGSHSSLKKNQARKHSAQHHKRAKKPGTKQAVPAKKGVQARAVYCVNVANNETLMAREADRQLPVASLTKLVTALVTLDSMPLDRQVTVPDHIEKVPKSVVGLKPGDKLSVQDLLHGLLMASGNDCAETLACAHPNGRGQFIHAMNRKVRSLGTKRTVFYTPSGLDRKVVRSREGKDIIDVDSNVSTAKEIALIARAAFGHKTVREICLKKNHVMAATEKQDGYAIRNTNKLLRDNLPVVGGKTGYTSRAGHCIVTELAHGKNDFLIVVLGSPDQFRDARLVYRKAIEVSSRSKSQRDRNSGNLTARADHLSDN
jgi:D-alanyl-D-alanine carboxypeptidase